MNFNSKNINYKDFYSSKINHLTLSEALDLHYELNPQFTKWSEYGSKLEQNMMKSHDIMHIIFGCDTSLKSELRVELFTLFCNNLSLQEYKKIVSNSEVTKEPLEIAKKVGLFKFFWVLISHIYYLPYSYYISLKMTKKLPILSMDQYLNHKIGEIRKEFNLPCQ